MRAWRLMWGPCGLLCTACVINLMLSLLSETLVGFYVTDFHATDRDDGGPAVRTFGLTCLHALVAYWVIS